MDRRIDLDRARRDAKALLRAAREGDAAALARLRGDREPRLADAQRAVARGLGATSWPALVHRLEAQDDADARELLAAAFAGEHRAALARAGERPRAAQRLRARHAGELLRAAHEDRADAASTLLELGVDPNVRDPATGGTALHVAARRGHLDVVGVLVGWVHVDRSARDDAGASALAACVEGSREAPDGARRGHLAVAKVLVATGARVEPGLAARAPGELARWLAAQPARPSAPALDAQLGEAAWAAEVALLAHLATAPLAERQTVGDGFAVRTGLEDNSRNVVVCSRLEAGEADDRIAEALAWLRAPTAEGGWSDVPGQWLVGPHTEPADLRERLERAGCRPERRAVVMAARLDTLELGDARAPAGLAVAPAVDPRTLAELLGDEREAALLASLELDDDDAPLRHRVAWLGGSAVGIVSVFAHAATVSLTALEVVAGARRRGIGRALVTHVLREARAAGCELALLAPTPATVPFYEALGFALHRLPPDRTLYTP